MRAMTARLLAALVILSSVVAGGDPTRDRPPPAIGPLPGSEPFSPKLQGEFAIAGYVSGFNLINSTLAVTFPNVIGTQPVRLFAEHVHNWDAATSDDTGWQAGARLGQPKVKGDWSLYGFYERIEQEAAISSFTYSDFGNGGTNQEGPVVGIDYQLLNPLTITAKSHFTNFINRPTNTTNGTLTRFQLDALVKF